MAKIPLIQAQAMDYNRPGTPYDISVENNARIAEIKNINAKIDLVDTFQREYEQAQDFADDAKAKQAIQTLGFALKEQEEKARLDGLPRYSTDGKSLIWNDLNKTIQDFKKNELPKLISSRNLRMYETEFDLTASNWEGQHNQQIRKEYTMGMAYDIGNQYVINLNLGTPEALKEAEIQYKQIASIAGEPTAKQFRSQGVLRGYDIKRNEALEIYKRDNDWTKYTKTIESIGKKNGKPDPRLSSQDFMKNEDNNTKMINGLKEQFVQMLTDSTESINQAIAEGKSIDIQTIGNGFRQLPEEYQNLLIKRMEAQVQSYISLTDADFLVDEPIAKFFRLYQDVQEKDKFSAVGKSYEDMYEVAEKIKNPALQDVAIIMLGELTTDIAQDTGATQAIFDRGETNWFKELFLVGEEQIPSIQADAEFFKNVQTIMPLVPAGQRAKAYKDVTVEYWQKFRGKAKRRATISTEEISNVMKEIFGQYANRMLDVSTESNTILTNPNATNILDAMAENPNIQVLGFEEGYSAGE